MGYAEAISLSLLNRSRARSRSLIVVGRETERGRGRARFMHLARRKKKIGGESNLLLFQQTTELNVVRSTSWRRFSSPAKQPF
jgi:hypothetical protein